MAHSLRWSDLQLKTPIGEGHSATVWLATLARSYSGLPKESPVAVKRYKRWVLDESGQFERIYRQREVAALVQHPHLVRTFGLVADPEGLPALVMEYVPGETLAERRTRLGVEKNMFTAAQALSLVGEIAGALAALHDAGFVHRDVKPANIILGPSGAVLADMGVISSGHLVDATTTGAFLGTIRYAAPEYLFGGSFDYRSDFFSLGAVAFELFFGIDFYHGFDQWATLIGARYIDRNRESHPPLYLPDMYKLLSLRFTINGAEAMRYILQATLTTPSERRIDLRGLADASKEAFWENAFHIDEGTVIRGEPDLPKLGTWGNSAGQLKPSEIAAELRLRVSPSTFQIIPYCLERDYWYGFTDETSLGTEFHELATVGAAVNEGDASDCGTVQRWRWHDSVRAAFRYGYLLRGQATTRDDMESPRLP